MQTRCSTDQVHSWKEIWPTHTWHYHEQTRLTRFHDFMYRFSIRPISFAFEELPTYSKIPISFLYVNVKRRGGKEGTWDEGKSYPTTTSWSTSRIWHCVEIFLQTLNGDEVHAAVHTLFIEKGVWVKGVHQKHEGVLGILCCIIYYNEISFS